MDDPRKTYGTLKQSLILQSHKRKPTPKTTERYVYCLLSKRVAFAYSLILHVSSDPPLRAPPEGVGGGVEPVGEALKTSPLGPVSTSDQGSASAKMGPVKLQFTFTTN